MMPTLRQRAATRAFSPISEGAGDLGFTIDLWDRARRRREAVVGHAADLAVARAIFDSAAREYPGRLLVLRQGERTLQTTG